MTVIKQKGITSVKHGKNLMRYIDNDKALLRDSQNLINPNRWYAEMERTREEFGHDKAKGLSKNTIIHHQMLNFLPEECDMNDGVMTPELCMNYAKEYASSYYGDHQVIFALHKEHCKADDTHRYSVHMAINRSNLMTGNRLDEGRAKVAKQIRAGHVRDMDEKWKLSQLKKGVRNSMIHDKQPSRTEREIENNGRFSYKTNLRKLMTLAKEETTSLESWVEKMTEWGADVAIENDRVYITDTDNSRYSFRADKLDYDFEINKLIMDISTPEHRKSADITKIKRKMGQDIKNRRNAAIEQEKYATEIEKKFAEYKEMAASMKGVDY